MISERCPLNLSDDELSRWHDDDLPIARMEAIRAHSASCPACRERLTAFAEIGAGLRGLEPPPLDLARLLAHLPAASPDSAPRLIPLATPRRGPRRSWRVVTSAAGLVAVLLLSLFAGYLFATHGRPQSPQRKRTITATATITPGSQTSMTSIAMLSPDDGWAMGQTYHTGNSGEDPAYVLRYTNGRWVPVKTEIRGRIGAIKLFSASDGWAVGDWVYHYDGSAWRQIMLPGNQGGYFASLAAVSPTAIWIASQDPDDNRARILHYDGHSWTRQPTPPLGDFFSVYGLAMVSATDGWAVGSAMLDGDKGYFPPTGAILHYSNGVWRLAKSLPNYDLRAISMGSANSGWAGGSLVTLSQTGPMPPGKSPFQTNTAALWRFTGGQWVQTHVPGITDRSSNGQTLSGEIAGITMFSATDGWLFAGLNGQQPYLSQSAWLGPSMFRLEQGRWVAVPSVEIEQRRFANLGQPAFLAPDDFWVVGSCIWWTGIPQDSGGYMPTITPLIVHYHNGAWDILSK